ncbi:LPD7 domain-containing protein, partial [Acidithiobacillus sp.]|uniref:LPD7 domain-containing protein n=1 Tax=Acidithiobacillus sp. TaxID=1872118 RepID=UPI003D060C77
LERLKRLAADDPAADIAKIAAEMKADAEIPLLPAKAHAAPTFEEKIPPETLAHRLGVATAKDYGNRIVVTRMGMLAITPPQKRERQELVTAALLKSRERFGEPVRITGNKAFENEVIKAAIAQGIPLEMASDRGAVAYQLALKNEQSKGLEKTMGRMEPAKEKAMALPAEKAPPAKGRGLQL